MSSDRIRRMSKPAIAAIVGGGVLLAGLLSGIIYIIIKFNTQPEVTPPPPIKTPAQELEAKFQDLEKSITDFELGRDASLLPSLKTKYEQFSSDLFKADKSLRNKYPNITYSAETFIKPKIESVLETLVNDIDELDQSFKLAEILSKKKMIEDITNAASAELNLTLNIFYKIKDSVVTNLRKAFLKPRSFNPDNFGKELKAVRSSLRYLIKEDRKDPVLGKDDSDDEMLRKIYIFCLPDLEEEFKRLTEVNKDNKDILDKIDSAFNDLFSTLLLLPAGTSPFQVMSDEERLRKEFGTINAKLDVFSNETFIEADVNGLKPLAQRIDKFKKSVNSLPEGTLKNSFSPLMKDIKELFTPILNHAVNKLILDINSGNDRKHELGSLNAIASELIGADYPGADRVKVVITPPPPIKTPAQELAAKFQDLEKSITDFELGRDASLLPSLKTKYEQFHNDLFKVDDSLRSTYPNITYSAETFIKPKIESVLETLVRDIDALEQSSKLAEIPSKKKTIGDIIKAASTELQLLLVPKCTLDEFHMIKNSVITNLRNAFLKPHSFQINSFRKELEDVRSSLRNLIREDLRHPVLGKDDSDEEMIRKIYTSCLPYLEKEFKRLIEVNKDNKDKRDEIDSAFNALFSKILPAETSPFQVKSDEEHLLKEFDAIYSTLSLFVKEKFIEDVIKGLKPLAQRIDNFKKSVNSLPEGTLKNSFSPLMKDIKELSTLVINHAVDMLILDINSGDDRKAELGSLNAIASELIGVDYPGADRVKDVLTQSETKYLSDIQAEIIPLTALLEKIKNGEDFAKFWDAFASLKAKFESLSDETLKTKGVLSFSQNLAQTINKLADDLHKAILEKQKSEKLDLEVVELGALNDLFNDFVQNELECEYLHYNKIKDWTELMSSDKGKYEALKSSLIKDTLDGLVDRITLGDDSGKVKDSLSKLSIAIGQSPFKDTESTFLVSDSDNDLVKKILESPLHKDTLPSSISRVIATQFDNYNFQRAMNILENFRKVLATYNANVDCDLCKCENLVQVARLLEFSFDELHYKIHKQSAERSLMNAYKGVSTLDKLDRFLPFINNLNFCIEFRDNKIIDAYYPEVIKIENVRGFLMDKIAKLVETRGFRLDFLNLIFEILSSQNRLAESLSEGIFLRENLKTYKKSSIEVREAMSKFISYPELNERDSCLKNLAYAIWRLTYTPCSKLFIERLLTEEKFPEHYHSLLIEGEGAFLADGKKLAFVNPDVTIALLMDTLNDALSPNFTPYLEEDPQDTINRILNLLPDTSIITVSALSSEDPDIPFLRNKNYDFSSPLLNLALPFKEKIKETLPVPNPNNVKELHFKSNLDESDLFDNEILSEESTNFMKFFGDQILGEIIEQDDTKVFKDFLTRYNNPYTWKGIIDSGRNPNLDEEAFYSNVIYGALQLLYLQSTPDPLKLKSFIKVAHNFRPTVHIDPRSMAILAACHYHQMSRKIGVTLPLDIELSNKGSRIFVQNVYKKNNIPSEYINSMGIPMVTYEGKILGISNISLPKELTAPFETLAKNLNDRALSVCLKSRMLTSFDAYIEYFNRLCPDPYFFEAQLYFNRLDSHLIENNYSRHGFSGFYLTFLNAITLTIPDYEGNLIQLKIDLQNILSAVLNIEGHKDVNLRRLKHLYFLMNASPSYPLSEIPYNLFSLTVNQASPEFPEKITFSFPGRILINTNLSDLTAERIFRLIQTEAKFTSPTPDHIFNDTLELFIKSLPQFVEKPSFAYTKVNPQCELLKHTLLFYPATDQIKKAEINFSDSIEDVRNKILIYIFDDLVKACADVLHDSLDSGEVAEAKRIYDKLHAFKDKFNVKTNYVSIILSNFNDIIKRYNLPTEHFHPFISSFSELTNAIVASNKISDAIFKDKNSEALILRVIEDAKSFFKKPDYSFQDLLIFFGINPETHTILDDQQSRIFQHDDNILGLLKKDLDKKLGGFATKEDLINNITVNLLDDLIEPSRNFFIGINLKYLLVTSFLASKTKIVNISNPTHLDPIKFSVEEVLKHFSGLNNDGQDTLIDFFNSLSHFKAFSRFSLLDTTTLPVIGTDASFPLSLSYLLYLLKNKSLPIPTHVLESLDTTILESESKFKNAFAQLLVNVLEDIFSSSHTSFNSENHNETLNMISQENNIKEVAHHFFITRLNQIRDKKG